MAFFISSLYPIVLLLIFKYLGMSLDEIIALKAYPLLMSLYISILIGLSYWKKDSFILKFAVRFSKASLSQDEVAYIRSSTLFWFCITLINVTLHASVFLWCSDYCWVLYATVGWYFVFGLAGVLQYLHRKFIFLKRVENV